MKEKILLVIFFSFTFNCAISQECTTGSCSNFYNQYPTTTLTPTSSWSLKSGMNGGNWTLFSVTCGNVYEFTYGEAYGGVSTNWDAQLTLYNYANNDLLCFSDDNTGTNGDAPYIQWVATFSGTVRLLTSEFPCSSNAPNPPFNKLAYRSVALGWSTTPVSPYSISASGGSNFSFTVHTTVGTTYSATSNDSWIKNVVASSGGVVTYDVDLNTTSSRSGSISIKNGCGTTALTFSINQAGVSCIYSLNPTSSSLSSNASSGNFFNVNTTSGCNWNATSNDSWITITAGSTGSGNGSVYYSVNANGGSSALQGTITTGGKTFTVNQAGISCSYSLNPTSSNLSSNASSSNSFSVNTTSGCNWNSNSNDSWITITSGSSGTGTGTISFSVTGNGSSSSRQGTITAAGKTYTVYQDGISCSYTLNPSSSSLPSSASIGVLFHVYTSAGCSWSAASNDSWITINTGLSGTGNGNIYFSVSANGGTVSRQGTITAAGKTYTVNQAGSGSSTPTIVITSPNGGENWLINTNHNITGTITGLITGKQIDYSLDGGNNWIFITGISNSSTTLNNVWTVPNNTSTTCKIRVTIFYSGGSVSDVSDGDFIISSSSSGQPFRLDPNLAHLFWPFPNSSWDNRNNWYGGNESQGSGGNGWGDGGHHAGEYYAEDWNLVTSTGDCWENFYSPLDGIVIFIYNSCSDDCGKTPNCPYTGYNCKPVKGISPSGYGNEVIIQSTQKNAYVFRVTHLNAVYVNKGQSVSKGTLIGALGNTGGSYGSHAHCVLYKNVTNNNFAGAPAINKLNCGQSFGIDKTSPANIFACKFKFDATFDDGYGGGASDPAPITIIGNSILCKNDSTILKAPYAYSYFWSTGDTSRTIVVKKAGTYYVTVSDNLNNSSTSDPIAISVFETQTSSISTDNGNNFICSGSSKILSIDDASNILWSDNSTSTYITINNPGKYSVKFKNIIGCSISDTIIINSAITPQKPTILANGISLAANTILGVDYQWQLNGRLIINSNSQYLNADSSGYYTVTVIDKVSGCSNTSDPKYINVVGLDEFNILNNIAIYPNPINNEINIEMDLSLNQKEISFIIFNSLGQKVIHKSLNNVTIGHQKGTLNLQDLPNGIYTLEIKLENGKAVFQKLIIQK